MPSIKVINNNNNNNNNNKVMALRNLGFFSLLISAINTCPF
jgi:hypothetical protein